MQFGVTLKELRLEKNMTQVELAKIANLAPSCIAMIETNKREPGASTIIALSLALGISADYLLGLEDDCGVKKFESNYAHLKNDLSNQEKELVEEFRKLPESSKKLVLRMVGINTGEQSEKKKA